MIRRLTEKDRDSLLEYLYQEPNYNIFPIGDIENFGFDKNFLRCYGEFDEDNNYLSIFLRYRDNAIYYSNRNSFNLEYLEIFKLDPFTFFSGKTELVDLIVPYLPKGERKQTYFSNAKVLLQDLKYDKSLIKKVSTEEECSKLYDLLASIEEFSVMKKSKAEFVRNKMESLSMGLTIYIESENRIVSTVATTAETSKNAMVVAVATDKEYRKKGYATYLLHALMHEYLINKNKELCLFFDNPKAGKIYEQLGFKCIGKWDMYTVNV